MQTPATTQHTSIEDRNKDVVRRYVEAFNRGDITALRSLLADDAEIQGVMGRVCSSALSRFGVS